MGAIMHDCKNGLSPQPPNLARNNVEALENPDLVLDGRDNRAVLVWALGIEPHWAEGKRWSTAGFTESSACRNGPVILVTLRLNRGTSKRRVWMGESGLEDGEKERKCLDTGSADVVLGVIT